ncbi:MAG: hypothetical protein JNJ54_12380 [Myxococcaceae bacterium]|nr:hypothetical protein [Myxococcaceae bacterium]
MISAARWLSGVAVGAVVLVVMLAFIARGGWSVFGVVALLLAVWGARRVEARTPLTAIVLLGALVRVAWIVAVPTEPGSDFAAYHAFAVRAVEGQLNERLYAPLVLHQVGYPQFLSGAYLVFGAAPAVGRWLNVALAMWLIAAVFRLGTRLSGRRAGVFAALAIALWPDHVAYSSLLASELLFTPLVWVGLERALTKRSGRALGAGLLIGAAIAVRSPGVLALLVALGLLVALRRYRAALALVVGASLALGGSLALRRLTGDTFARGSLAYSALMGSNAATQGAWNQHDYEAYLRNRFVAGARVADDEAWALVRLRWAEAGVTELVLGKVARQWGQGDSGVRFALRNALKAPGEAMAALAQAWLVGVVTLAWWALWRVRPVVRWGLAPLTLAWLAHLVLEANPRYALPWLVGAALVAACGWRTLSAWRPSSPASPR